MIRFLRRVLPFLPDPAPRLAHVRLEGVIGRPGRAQRGLTLAGVETALTKAFAFPGEAAVAITINSPGGSPVQSRLIHDRIRQLAEEKNRRVFVFCEDVAASGGYMLACAGDEVFADASSLIGSIGVVGAFFGAQEAIAKLGVERRVYTAGKNKVRLDPFRPEDPDDVAFVERIQASIHADFIDLVKTRRGDKLDTATDLFQGDVWTGREAMGLGLVDGLGHLHAILREKFGDALQVRSFAPARPGLLQCLLCGASEVVLAAIEERLAWSRFGI